ncbi:hypothetical protein ColTof4_08498 [Colletotrichum tofieldiae]|nr:hypothetical protein ColTof3_01977 [Colletotrichum tofieldiae]GKT76075.1 hypothetical protein ColTof4_08498 [Colletotrichum tofieldiae]
MHPRPAQTQANEPKRQERGEELAPDGLAHQVARDVFIVTSPATPAHTRDHHTGVCQPRNRPQKERHGGPTPKEDIAGGADWIVPAGRKAGLSRLPPV